MRVRYSLRARHDIQGIYDYIKQQGPGGAKAVAEDIRAAVDFVGQHPKGSQQTDEPGVRVKLVVGRPYKVFYRIRSDGIEILHMRHGSRRSWEDDDRR